MGEEWIITTVEHAISFKPGNEVAMNCLHLLKSEKAVLYGYDAYKSSTGDRASQAVWLIKRICHPIALNWVDEFLSDENVAKEGLGVLDQLLWSEQIDVDDNVTQLLNKADTIFDGQMKNGVEFIRLYLRERDEI